MWQPPFVFIEAAMIIETPKAIETHYNGYRFRSRLEARWAVFFDTLDVPYEYEKEGYDLGDAGWYLPDFWLPTHQVWLELKGDVPTAPELAKASQLAFVSGKRVFLFYGGIEYLGMSGITWHPSQDVKGPVRVGTCQTCASITFSWSDNELKDVNGHPYWYFLHKTHCSNLKIGGYYKNGRYIELHHAVKAARSARFEHGERGR